METERIIGSIRLVLADGAVLTAPEVLIQLRERGLVPDVNDPLGTVRYVLATRKDVFDHVLGGEARGRYRLGPSG